MSITSRYVISVFLRKDILCPVSTERCGWVGTVRMVSVVRLHQQPAGGGKQQRWRSSGSLGWFCLASSHLVLVCGHFFPDNLPNVNCNMVFVSCLPLSWAVMFFCLQSMHHVISAKSYCTMFQWMYN